MNKDSKPNQAYLWSNGVYHTKPESIATQEYANLIELQQKRIEELEADNMRLFTALKETLDAMELGDYPARHIAFSALSEGGADTSP